MASMKHLKLLAGCGVIPLAENFCTTMDREEIVDLQDFVTTRNVVIIPEWTTPSGSLSSSLSGKPHAERSLEYTSVSPTAPKLIWSP